MKKIVTNTSDANVEKYNYANAKELAEANDAKVSILLGDICYNIV